MNNQFYRVWTEYDFDCVTQSCLCSIVGLGEIIALISYFLLHIPMAVMTLYGNYLGYTTSRDYKDKRRMRVSLCLGYRDEDPGNETLHRGGRLSIEDSHFN
jgi:hypothetical protein